MEKEKPKFDLGIVKVVETNDKPLNWCGGPGCNQNQKN